MTIHEGYAGAQRAADHADRRDPLWSKLAWVRALQFVVQLGRGALFTTIELRKWCEAHGVTAPPDERAWGNITRKLAKRRVVCDTGMRVRTGSHGREVVQWRVL